MGDRSENVLPEQLSWQSASLVMRMSRVQLLSLAPYMKIFQVGFPSGQREQTVNLSAKPSEVQILPPPPASKQVVCRRFRFIQRNRQRLHGFFHNTYYTFLRKLIFSKSSFSGEVLNRDFMFYEREQLSWQSFSLPS